MKVLGESLAIGGSIVCSNLDPDDKKKVFVPFLIPGETAEVAITSQKSSLQEGKVTALTIAHPKRVPPPCEAFGMCGGCQLQHMPIDLERDVKLDMIRSYLSRQTKLPDVNVVDASAGLPEYGYRRRATFHLSHDGLLGFHAAGTRAVVPVRTCLIVEAELADTMPALQSFAKKVCDRVKTIEASLDKKLSLVFFVRDRTHPRELQRELEQFQRKIKADIYIKTKQQTFFLAGHGLVPSHSDQGHFTQVNRRGNDRLHQVVTAAIEGSSVTTATELYAGSGNFTFELAARGYVVHAVELDAQLVKAGQQKAKELTCHDRITFFQSPCETWVKKQALSELVLLDPPRAGAKDVVRLASWKAVRKLIYISCSLPSFARDAEALVLDHGLKLEQVAFVDMFPKTHHVELVGIFTRPDN
jgi:23S rRNA (uracil1939-C5)-methyltransferase